MRAPSAPYVGMEEFRLLAFIAIAQRMDVRGCRDWRACLDWDADMRDLLQACGEALAAAAGMILPHTCITRSSSLRKSSSTASLDDASATGLPLAERASPAIHMLSARARALALARSMASPQTRDFATVGVSRQTLSMLCKRGLLRRDAHGRYALVSVD